MSSESNGAKTFERWSEPHFYVKVMKTHQFSSVEYMLPEFPSTMHFPLEPNAASDDKVASEDDMLAFLSKGIVTVEEKVDGSNCGMCFDGDIALFRNRNHILNKAYRSRRTPAHQQYGPAWTWMHENRSAFARLNAILEKPVSVYGEWMFARHVLAYEALPSWMIAYDIFDIEASVFVAPTLSRPLLQEAGFHVVPLIAQGTFTPSDIMGFRDRPSAYGGTDQEGSYAKVELNGVLVDRMKIVAPWFKTDPEWNKKPLVKNTLMK